MGQGLALEMQKLHGQLWRCVPSPGGAHVGPMAGSWIRCWKKGRPWCEGLGSQDGKAAEQGSDVEAVSGIFFRAQNSH